jgi:hypothetical protein
MVFFLYSSMEGMIFLLGEFQWKISLPQESTCNSSAVNFAEENHFGGVRQCSKEIS